jgi:hypothetical protein
LRPWYSPFLLPYSQIRTKFLPISIHQVFRATHKLSDHIILHHKTRELNPYLLTAAIFTAINTALCINIFISLAFYGILYTLVAHHLRIPAAALFVLQYVGYGLYVAFRGVPSAYDEAIVNGLLAAGEYTGYETLVALSSLTAAISDHRNLAKFMFSRDLLKSHDGRLGRW